MTYTGKPSSACKTCRQRRIRCDEGRPACLQCKKARRECLGYPDPDILIFQNQTTSVIQRAKRIHNAKSKRTATVTILNPASSPAGSEYTSSTSSSEPLESTSSSPANSSPVSFQSSLDVAVVSIIPNPVVPVETRALEFFLTAQLLEPMSRGRVVGHLTFLPPLFSNSLSTSALSKVTTAAAVASFDLVGSESAVVRSSAYSSYGDAVRSLAIAMSSPDERVRNETLLACVLMVVVESMLAKDSSPHEEWSAHVMGASNLLRQRGRDAVSKDPVARRLWAVVRGFMMQNATIKLCEDELFATDLPTDGLEHHGPPPPEVRLGMLSIGTVKLTDQSLHILTYQSHVSASLHTLIESCQGLDGALCAWASNLPLSYHYSSILRSRDSSCPHVDLNLGEHNSHFAPSDTTLVDEHHYPDPHLQRIWNSYRLARIFLNAMIYRAAVSLAALEHYKTDLAASTAQTLQSLADEVLSSIPETVLDPKKTLSRNAVSAAGEIALAYYCLWPLYVTRGIVILPAAIKAEIFAKMKRIVDKYGIRNGKILLDIGFKDEQRPLWGTPWKDGWVESNWSWAFLYGCGAV